MTKSALEDSVMAIKSGRKPVLNIEHDVAIPLLGQVVDAWVEPTDDGEYQLVGTSETFDHQEEVCLPDGTIGIREWIENSPYPFAGVASTPPQSVTLAYDMANFASKGDLQIFLEEVRIGSELPVEMQVFMRKSLTPDPQIIITVTAEICMYLCTRKVGEPLMMEVGNDLAKLYSLLKATVIAMAQYSQPKNRAKTYVLDVPGVPHVQFVVRSNNAETIVSSIEVTKLRPAIDRAQDMQVIYGAEKVQFLFSVERGWEFNYLLTDRGVQIGTPESIARRARKVYLSDLGMDTLVDEALAERPLE